jgi:membrane-bound metal-dependent hydrolase YbcI (DUF457 family)
MNSVLFKTSNNSSRRAWLIIGIAVIIVIASSLVTPHYYQWLLNRENKVTLNIFCDTSELTISNLTIFLLYDRVALHPIAKAFGLFQLRNPEKATSFYALKIDNFCLTPYSITITNVPPAPLVRIQITSGKKHFYTLVKDRRVFNNILTVRPEPNSFLPIP